MVNPIPRDERARRESEERSRRERTPLRLTSVSVTLSRTLQVRQFEPIRVDVTQTAQIGNGENASDVRRELYESTSKALRTMMRAEFKKWAEEEAESDDN